MKLRRSHRLASTQSANVSLMSKRDLAPPKTIRLLVVLREMRIEAEARKVVCGSALIGLAAGRKFVCFASAALELGLELGRSAARSAGWSAGRLVGCSAVRLADQAKPVSLAHTHRALPISASWSPCARQMPAQLGRWR